MSTKPEGLSPCYFSLASPHIPASHMFRWTSPGAQTRATIRIFNSSQVLLHTYTHNSSLQYVDMSSVGFTFANNTTYFWTVTPQNGTTVYEASVMAKFRYANAPQRPSITWSPASPKVYDPIHRTSRFNEIKANLLVLLSNYGTAGTQMIERTNNLFTGEVVPSKFDFQELQDIIQFIGVQEGIEYKTTVIDGNTVKYEVLLAPQPGQKYDTSSPFFSSFSTLPSNASKHTLDVISWVGDSLGVSDIEKVIDYINYLTTIPPSRAESLSFTIPTASMYSMTSVTAKSDGKTDATIDVSWNSGDAPSVRARINFDELSNSKDVWFYECRFSYGPSGKFSSLLFFRPSDLASENNRTFDMNWSGLYTATNLSTARLQFEMFTVDHYANISPRRSVTKTWSSNLKVPLGVSHYILQSNKSGLSETSGPYTGRTWTQQYSGSNKSRTYTTTSAEGNLWHRVKVVDKSGLESEWRYASGYIVFDPLTAPAAPTNFRVTGTTTNSISLAWNTSARAEKYQVRRGSTTGTLIHDASGTTKTDTGRTQNTSYTYHLRAVNRAGNSSWVKVTGKTKSASVTTTWTSTSSKSWRNNWGWRNDTTRVYQGEWCEIEGSPNQTASAGTCWGKHRSFWYFNHSDIRSKLSGKTVTKVRLWIKRENTYHGYYHDQTVHLWMHNMNSGDRPATPSVSHHYPVPNPKFAKGDEAWINLPLAYATRIRDGNMKGIGVYVPNWGRLPYMYFNGRAKLEITYQ